MRWLLLALLPLSLGACNSCEREAPMSRGEPARVPSTRLVYNVPLPRAKSLARALAELLRGVSGATYQVRVDGNDVGIEVDVASAEKVKSAVASAMRFDMYRVGDDEDDPFFSREKLIPFPATVERDTFRVKDQPRYAKTPREHEARLAEVLAKWKVPDKTRFLLSRADATESFVRSYLVIEPSTVGGECLKGVEKTDDGVSMQLDEECGKHFEGVTGDNVGKRIAFVVDGRVVSAPVVKARITGGRVAITGATVDVARFKPASLSSDVKLVREEKM